MSLYAQYAKERAGLQMIETDDYFISFKVFPTHLYIEDIYIVPEKRNLGLCSKLFNETERLAKEVGIRKTLITISPISATATEVMQKMIKMNFKIYKSTDDLIYLSREIK